MTLPLRSNRDIDSAPWHTIRRLTAARISMVLLATATCALAGCAVAGVWASAASAAQSRSHAASTRAPSKHPVRCVAAKPKRKIKHSNGKALSAKARKAIKRCAAAHRKPKPKLPPKPALAPLPGALAIPAEIPVALTEALAPAPSPLLPPVLGASPANTVLPTIAGSAIEGRELDASSGTWTESPSSYGYQWQDCNSAGAACSNVSAATGSSYKLKAGDVGHELRVVVTAANAFGSTAATSPPTATVSAASQKLLLGSAAVQASTDTDSAGSAEAFEYTAFVSGTAHSLSLYVSAGNSAPTIMLGLYGSTAGHAGTLLASAKISSPKASAWNTVAISPVALSSGTVYWMAALAPSGTLALRDIESGAAPSQSSSSISLTTLPTSWSGGAWWTNSPASFYASTEAVEPPPPPAAPTNTAAPTVSGSAVEGETMAAGKGSWAGSPTSYGYQWELCDASGGGCQDVAGATSASYKLVAGDVGGTVRVVVTAANAGGSTAATSVQSSVVSAVPPPPPPAAPKNTAAPTIAGSAVEAETLTASKGSWTESPTSYAYQWELCNASGEACSHIAGATSASYKLVAGDVGDTIRVIVTATNAGGSTAADSLPSGVVVKKVLEEVHCSVTVPAGASASVIAGDLVSAVDGSTVCLSGGSYPFVRVVGAVHGGFVTVRPVPGAVVRVAGMEVVNSAFLRFVGLRMTEGFNMRDSASGASHDYQFVEDTFEEPLYGVVLYGGAGPIKRVLIEKNVMHRVHLEKPEVGGKCDAGYAQGQDVTIDYAEGVTIARNTFDEAAWHYIQGGGAGPEGVTVEHNLFEGHVLMKCSHLNLWQIWAGGQDDTFKDNIAIGEGTGEKNGLSEEAATDGVIFENGAGSVECQTTMKNSVIENNLFIDAADSYELQIYTTQTATIENNTVIGSEWGSALLTEHCGAGSNYTMTHNIDVEDQGNGYDVSMGACTGSCLFDYNVSQDNSANASGSTHYVTKWTPSWQTTSWNPNTQPTPPAGYYQPTNLPTELHTGYQGEIGP